MQIVFNKRIGKQRQATSTEHIRDLLQLSPSELLLLDACAKRSAHEVATLLATSPAFNLDAIRDKYLRTPLHLACSRQDDLDEATEMARVLVEAGADVNNGVGDMDGFKPMHLAVLAYNYKCVLLLLEKGAHVPATDPFRLTPLLLAKLKLDNLRMAQSNRSPPSDPSQAAIDAKPAEASRVEYSELYSITEVLVKHLAHKHMTVIGTPPRSPTHGLSERLLRKDDDLDDTITSLTDRLSTMDVGDTEPHLLQNNLNGLIDKIRQLGIQ
ncbi:ankyrin [Hesseltinella vesiculosa]|uniref:Ankyrin n=1 Tax=Hesseltinella vesiculosa TaxID=101127 RepID=A0A1X2GJW0_9FUNG|nr:ankyrin [Hesseltinella vesiculosa]